MADREAEDAEEWTGSFSKAILGGGELAEPEFPRRDSTSSTGSGKPIPPGHWILPITGNCPRCHHHHKSVKIHVKTTSEASRLVDLKCKNCHSLWLGHGSRNSTRVSLLSTETIDPAPTEAEDRTTLAQMVRVSTRVAVLSHALPNIPEGSSPGPTRGPPLRSAVRKQVRMSALGLDLASTNLPAPLVPSPVGVPVDHMIRPSTSGVENAQTPQLLLRLRQRIGGRLRATRIGRFMKAYEENDIHKSRQAQQWAQPNEDKHSLSGAGTRAVSNARSTPAEDQDCMMVVDQEVVNAMNVEQRYAFLRSTSTVAQPHSNDRYRPISVSNSQGMQGHPLAVIAARPNSRHSGLIGAGNIFGIVNHWEPSRESDLNLNRRSFSISETRPSEESTVVEDRVCASSRFLREALNRENRLSGPIRPPSMQSSLQGWEQTRQGRGELRSSIGSITTLRHRSVGSVRGTSSDRRSRL